MTCGFTVNLWAWLVLGSCTYKQPEVAQKQKRCQDLLWQGPGPKAPDVEGDPSGTSTFLFDPFFPCCYLMCSHQPLLPKSWPQLWISASSREIKLVSILCYSHAPTCFLDCALQSQQSAAVQRKLFITTYRQRKEVQTQNILCLYPYRAGPTCFMVWNCYSLCRTQFRR